MQTILLQIGDGGIMSILPFVAIMVVMYFFMIRPQMTRQKKEKKFQSEIKKGSKIVTTSGIHGRISEINNDDTITVETGAGKIRFEKSAISMELTNKYATSQTKK